MAFVPIAGAWMSAIIGAILILATEGFGKALGFVVLIIVIQQIEGNLIYSRVMGKRVGLPSLWVLVAITLGSGVPAYGACCCSYPSLPPPIRCSAMRSIPAGRGKALQRTHNARPSSAEHISPYR